MNYVTDTHSLVWYFTNNKSLSKKALSAFESTIKLGFYIMILKINNPILNAAYAAIKVKIVYIMEYN